MDSNDTVPKIVFASALFAGFAYFSLSILRDAFKKGDKRSNGKSSCFIGSVHFLVLIE